MRRDYCASARIITLNPQSLRLQACSAASTSPRHTRAGAFLMEEKMELVRMIKMVLWSFFGVRKSAAHELDLANVNFSLLPFVAVGLAVLIGACILGVVLLVAHSTGTAQGF
jgi:hypothetical protein